MLEPIIFVAFIVGSIAIMYLLEKLLSRLCLPFMKLMDKLHAVPEDECEYIKEKPISARTDTGKGRKVS